MISSHRADSWWRKACRTVSRLMAVVAIALPLVAAPSPARAVDDDSPTDGRLEGYGSSRGGESNVTNVALTKSGTGGTWIIFMLLSVLGCSVLFKNAKRSHLD